MKTLIAAAALIATVSSASASTSATSEIARFIGADQAASLTQAQTLTALSVIGSGDSHSDIRNKLRNIVQ